MLNNISNNGFNDVDLIYGVVGLFDEDNKDYETNLFPHVKLEKTTRQNGGLWKLMPFLKFQIWLFLHFMFFLSLQR